MQINPISLTKDLTKNGSTSAETLVNNTDTTITTNALLVVSASIAENIQYSGFTVYVNGIIVDSYGYVGLSNPACTITRAFRVNAGDVVKVAFNTSHGTTGTAKLYV